MFYHLYYICHRLSYIRHCLSKEHGGVKVFETGSAEKLLHPEQNNEGKAGRDYDHGAAEAEGTVTQ